MSNTITILMATYNGEKYLRNQLLSLLQQTHEDWVLWIRDDGSTDQTLAMIDEFCKRDSRIRFSPSSQTKAGAAKNFFSLLPLSQTPYTIFCDQDDIWFEKKLEHLLAHASIHLRPDRPGFVYCDAYSYESTQGRITASSVSYLHATSLQEFLFFNSGYQGCSILFNAPLCQMATAYTPPFFMHDDIISLLGHTFGDVAFLPLPLMLYRQHNANVTQQIHRTLGSILKSFFRPKAAVISQPHYEEKRAFFTFYHEKLSPEQRTLFEAYLNYPHRSFIGRLMTVLRHRFSLGGHHLVLIAKTLLRRPLA